MSSSKPKRPVQRPAKKPAVRKKVYREKSVYLFFMSICLLQTLFVGMLLFTYVNLNIPNISSVANYRPAVATVIYDRHGNIVDRMFTENRTVIPLSQMSPFLTKAFVAAEDGRFFEHPGLDFVSVLRAAINNFRQGAKSQGGSTITQQVTKSLLLTPEKTYIRKIKESILAWRIDKMLSKEEILFIYLNQIYLGEGAYGVEAAAQVYFGKSASQLSLGESALLAGLPQAPSRYSLFKHMDRASVRQKYVLNRMAADGYVSSAVAKKAYEEKIKLNSRVQYATDENAYYLQIVKKKARAYLQGPLQSAGVKIYTYLDSAMQRQALEAVRRGVKASKSRQVIAGKKVEFPPQAALVCIETKNSKIRALVGGTSFKKSPFNRATQAKRPVGSTFKPLVYAVALQQGWTPQSAINDRPLSIRGKDGKTWSPKNYAGSYHGTTTLAAALAGSYNAASVRLMQKVGYKDVHQLAKDVGISAVLPPDLSLALGSADISLLQMTGGYLPFAGDGTYLKPQCIQKMILPDGTVVYPEQRGKRRRVLSPRVTVDMRQMLRGVVVHGTGRKVADVPGVQGGKTGTSDKSRDGWFIGYDTRYTTGIWVGYDHNRSMGKKESGGVTAAPIWRDYMLSLSSPH
ncbi:MAG: penicillin-binding protein [Desulfotalea sp.]|nr:MAG: penicillin-binding protein [Desulfotalea sp.]